MTKKKAVPIRIIDSTNSVHTLISSSILDVPRPVCRTLNGKGVLRSHCPDLTQRTISNIYAVKSLATMGGAVFVRFDTIEWPDSLGPLIQGNFG